MSKLSYVTLIAGVFLLMFSVHQFWLGVHNLDLLLNDYKWLHLYNRHLTLETQSHLRIEDLRETLKGQQVPVEKLADLGFNQLRQGLFLGIAAGLLLGSGLLGIKLGEESCP